MEINGKKIDKQADKFFRNCFGTSRTSTGYERSWDSTHEDLRPTKFIEIGGKERCIYCGNIMLPIQAWIMRQNNYSITGYCCICKDAFKELEYRDNMESLKQKQYEEREKLKLTKPKENIGLLISIRTEAFNKKMREGDLTLKDLED
jgi:hypothetical protein